MEQITTSTRSYADTERLVQQHHENVTSSSSHQGGGKKVKLIQLEGCKCKVTRLEVDFSGSERYASNQARNLSPSGRPSNALMQEFVKSADWTPLRHDNLEFRHRVAHVTVGAGVGAAVAATTPVGWVLALGGGLLGGLALSALRLREVKWQAWMQSELIKQVWEDLNASINKTESDVVNYDLCRVNGGLMLFPVFVTPWSGTVDYRDLVAAVEEEGYPKSLLQSWRPDYKKMALLDRELLRILRDNEGLRHLSPRVKKGVQWVRFTLRMHLLEFVKILENEIQEAEDSGRIDVDVGYRRRKAVVDCAGGKAFVKELKSWGESLGGCKGVQGLIQETFVNLTKMAPQHLVRARCYNRLKDSRGTPWHNRHPEMDRRPTWADTWNFIKSLGRVTGAQPHDSQRWRVLAGPHLSASSLQA